MATLLAKEARRALLARRNPCGSPPAQARWLHASATAGARVGFIGLGNMGRPMALNLLKGGHEVIAFDRQ